MGYNCSPIFFRSGIQQQFKVTQKLMVPCSISAIQCTRYLHCKNNTPNLKSLEDNLNPWIKIAVIICCGILSCYERFKSYFSSLQPPSSYIEQGGSSHFDKTD